MAIFGRFGRSKEPKHKESTSTPSAPVLPRSNPAANLIQPISFSPSPFATAEPALESTMDGNPFVIVESEGEPSRGTTDAAGDGLRKIEEERRLGRAVLSVEDATELVELCSVQIRERGLTTLGLFRPYRTQESPDVIRETCVLFLMHTESKSAGSAGSDGIAGRDAGGRELWKVSNLDLFKESLRSVRVEDVVCVLKWGLRHISYRKTGFASSSSPSSPLYWYTKYVNDPASHATPSTSFQTFLLPSLPASSRKLLLEILPLMQLVLAQTDLNAMTLRRLSRTFGIYLFGLAGKDSRYKSWEDFYKIWNEAGEALEGCLQWHLRGQVKLPLRLREIRDSKERGRKVKVVLVSIESQGDWKKSSGSQSTSKLSGRPLRRTPVEALRVAFEATESTPGTTDEEREALAVWTAIKDSTRRKLDDPTSVLDDESRRIYKLLGFTTNVKTPSEPLAPLSSPALSSVRASPVVPSPAMSSPTLTIKNVERTPTWTEFASGGFTTDEPFEGKEFGFVKPTERPKSKSVGSKSARSNSTKSLKKMDYSPRSSPRSTVVSPLPPAAPPLVPQPFSTILSIRIVEVDEEFPDFYSDSLGDGLCNSWPSFLISELSSSIVATLPSKINYILLSDNLIPFRNPSSSTTPLSPITSAKTTSSAKSFVSTSESTKRRFFSSARMSGIFTSSLANKAKSAAALKPPPLPPQTSATPPRPVRPVGELIKLESTPKREYITEFEGPPSSPSTKAPALMAVAAVAGAGAATAGLVKSSSNAISLDSPSSIYEQIFRENDAEVALQQPTINEPVQEESPKDLVVEDDLAWPPKEDLERAAEKETQGFEEEEEETVVFAGIDEGKQDVEQESIPSPDPTDAPPSPVLATILDADEVEEETVEDQTIAEPISNPLESLPPSIDTSATIPDISPLDHSSPSEPLDISPTPTEPISAEIEPLAEVEAPELPVVESPLAQASTPVLFTPIISPSTTGSTVEEEESPIVGTIVPSSIPASPLLAQDVEQLAATPESSAAAVEREIIAVDVEEGVEEIPAVEAAPDAVEPAVEQEVRENGLAKKVSVETLRGTEIVEDPDTVEPETIAPVDSEETLSNGVAAEEASVVADKPALPPAAPVTPSKPITAILPPAASPLLSKSLFSKKSSETPRQSPTPSSTASLKSSSSPASASKRFLSGGLNLLRRKKSTPNVKLAAAAGGMSKATAAIEERGTKDLRETEKMDRRKEKVSTPKVVSSVRLRVEELEARKKKEREMATPTRLPKSASAGAGGSIIPLVFAPPPPPPSIPPPSAPLPAEPTVPIPVESTASPVETALPVESDEQEIVALPSPSADETLLLPSRATEELSPTESTFSSMETDREEEGKVGLGFVNESVVSFASVADSQAHSFATARSDQTQS